jgi:hypothetical protein
MAKKPIAQDVKKIVNEDKQIIGKTYFLPKQAVDLSEQNNLLDFNKIAFGTDQKYNNAPMNVPVGFATQNPYNSAINSTIITNPSTIPVTDLYKMKTTNPVVSQCCLAISTSITSIIGDYVDKNKQHEKIIRNMLSRIGKNNLINSLSNAITWAGHTDLKLIWHDPRVDGNLIDGVTNIKAFLEIPQDTVLLAVTPEGYLDPNFGVMQYYYNSGSQWQQNPKAFSRYRNAPFAAFGSYLYPQRTVGLNPLFLSAIDEDWRIHFAFNTGGLIGNHYGTPLAISAYSANLGYDQQLIKIALAAAFKASPLVIFKTDPQVKVDLGNGQYIKLSENVNNTVSHTQNGYMVVDTIHGMEVVTVDNTADMLHMTHVADFHAQQIRTAFCVDDMVNNAGSYANATANSQSKKDIIQSFALTIRDDPLKDLIKKFKTYAFYGGEPQDEEDYGYFEIKNTSLQDQAVATKVMETLANIQVNGTPILDGDNLDDINSVRRAGGLSEADELPKKIEIEEQKMFGSSKKININKTKQESKVPYANGGANQIKSKQYNK